MNLLSSLWTTIQFVWPMIIALTVLVFTHELGHYIAARICGVAVKRFSIGFGPKIIGFKDRNNTTWQIAAIPLGGYLEMFGDADPSSTKRDTGEYGPTSILSKTPLQRIFISAAGPIANYIFAILLTSLIFVFYGEIKKTTIIQEVKTESVASKNGLKAGDEIIAINENRISNMQEIKENVTRSVKNDKPENIFFTINRDNSEIKINIPIEMNKETEIEEIGIKFLICKKDHSLISAICAGTTSTFVITCKIAKHFANIITGKSSARNLAGIIQIAKISSDAINFGILTFVQFLIMLSINLGFVNLLPIPISDGGSIMLSIIEKIKGKPISDKALSIVFTIGITLLITIITFTIINDLISLNVVEKLKASFLELVGYKCSQ